VVSAIGISTAGIQPNSTVDIWSTTGLFPSDKFLLTGRTPVWNQAINGFAESPVFGFGFHADRLVLNHHLHNSVIHAMLQTGTLGTIPFIFAFLLAWYLVIRLMRLRHLLSDEHANTVVTVGALLAFFSFRSLFESTAAFFGVDWLLVSPLLLYLSVLYYSLGTNHEV